MRLVVYVDSSKALTARKVAILPRHKKLVMGIGLSHTSGDGVRGIASSTVMSIVRQHVDALRVE